MSNYRQSLKITQMSSFVIFISRIQLVQLSNTRFQYLCNKQNGKWPVSHSPPPPPPQKKKKLFFYFRFYNLSTHVVTEEVYSLYQIAFGPARNPYRTRLNNTLPHSSGEERCVTTQKTAVQQTIVHPKSEELGAISVTERSAAASNMKMDRHLSKTFLCHSTGAHSLQRVTPILGPCHGVFTDRFI